jgi:hypothetical protein
MADLPLGNGPIMTRLAGGQALRVAEDHLPSQVPRVPRVPRALRAESGPHLVAAATTSCASARTLSSASLETNDSP